MTAYVIADIEVTDPAAYEGYKSAVGATIAAFGGRYLSRAGHTEVLEGGWRSRGGWWMSWLTPAGRF